MNIFFEGDDTICMLKGNVKECFTKKNYVSKFDCGGTDVCELDTSMYDFYCVGGIQSQYQNCKYNDPPHGDKIGGSQLVYSCTSNTNSSNPNENDTFTCQSKNIETIQSGKEITTSDVQNTVKSNEEKIDYIMNVLEEIPGHRQSTLTLHNS